MGLKPFLYRPPLLPDESLTSYIYRLALANEHAPGIIEALCHEELPWRDKVSSPSYSNTFTVLQQLTCLEPYKIYWASVYGLAQLIIPKTIQQEYISVPPSFTLPQAPRNFIRQHLRHEDSSQFCPYCLAEAAYQRRAWQLKMVAACPRHGCLLLANCPACGKKVGTVDLVTARCKHCHFDLKAAPVIDVSADEVGLQSQAVLYYWLNSGRHVSLSLPRQPVCVLYDVWHMVMQMVFRIERDMEGMHPVPRLPVPFAWNSNSVHQPIYYYVAAATALQALENWPVGFHDFLERYRYRDGQLFNVSLQTQFFYLFQTYLDWWRNEGYEFVYEAFLDYVAIHSAWPITQRYIHFQNFPMARARFTWMVMAEACTELGVTASIVKRLIAYGSIRILEETASTHIKFVSRVDVMAVKQRWERAIPMEDAATWLGVSDEVVKQLIEIGLLTATRGPTVDRSAVWKVDRGSIERLLQTVHSTATYNKGDRKNKVDLTLATQMLSAYKFNAARVLQEAFRGKLRFACGRRHVLDRIFFYKQDIVMLLEELQATQEYISLAGVAKMMGVKAEVIVGWVERELLAPAYTNDVGTFFKRDDAELFAADYVRTAKAARILGVSELMVQKWARAGRLQPVSGPGVDERGVYLFRRTDCERLSPYNRLTAPQLARRLGISPTQLQTRIQDGTIRPFSGPGIDGCGRYLFLLDEWDKGRN